MHSAATVYRFAQVAMRAFTPLVGRGGSKFSRGMRGRLDAHERLVAWGAGRRPGGQPTVWVHAPSVGEGLQARAVIEALMVVVPGAEVLFTHFSPSAEPLAQRIPAAFADYLPWDVPSAVGPVLDAVRPDLIVFTKTEVWPVLVAEAARRGIPAALVAGTVTPASGRARWPAVPLLRPTWDSLAAVGAVSRGDRDGFEALGVRTERIDVTGDPAMDAAWSRVALAERRLPHLAPFHARPAPTVIAGSTWASDEAVLLPAVAGLKEEEPELRVVIAPHEPSAAGVRRLMMRLGRAGFDAAPLSVVEGTATLGSSDAVVVDRVGPLAGLYTVADVAYVGGGFHGKGLHSVLEPAAAGLPVVFGPRHRGVRAAGDLVDRGAAEVADGAPRLATILATWLGDPGLRHYTGALGLGYIHAHLGAAERSAALLKRIIDQRAESR